MPFGRPFVQAKFPGRPCAVAFDFDFDEPPSPKDVFEIAVTAKNAGWKIRKEQLEEQTGYTLEEDAAQNPSNPYANGLQNARLFANKRVDAPDGEELEPPLKSKEKNGVLEAFAKDTGPAADAIHALLEDPTPEKAKALLADIDKLIPEYPALAAVIAEEMAKEFQQTFTNETPADKPAPGSVERTRHDGAGAIARLKSVALTNRPNIPVAPILNKAPQPVNPNVEDTKETPMMEKLKELLGFAPEATEEDILAAVGKLKEQNAALDNTTAITTSTAVTIPAVGTATIKDYDGLASAKDWFDPTTSVLVVNGAEWANIKALMHANHLSASPPSAAPPRPPRPASSASAPRPLRHRSGRARREHLPGRRRNRDGGEPQDVLPHEGNMDRLPE